MTNNTTIDASEVEKFAHLAEDWWDENGALCTLHDINPLRLSFIENIAPLSDKRVLDVGCGGGVLAEAMARRGADVTGLDVESAAIAAAKLHATQERIVINYCCQPIEVFDAEAFDIITCMEMLEHVQNPQLVIDNCARLLKPGGYLFLSTINRTLSAYLGAIVMAEYVLKLLPRLTHDFDKLIKPSELADMTRAAGLETFSLQGLAYNPLTRQATMNDSVAINYLMACQKI